MGEFESIEEWSAFCKNASDDQLRGIFDKERNANRRFLAFLARKEAESRGVDVSDWPFIRPDKNEGV